MEFLELVKSRGSIRSFLSQKVSQEDLDYILECVRMAPSAVNFQPWKFYVCQSDESLNNIRQCYNRDWFATAPLVIIACVS